ncbi:hypothetical protein AB0M11_38055 [Streptomyces sp. NPDC051987]|uniref:hypothetical protein n=1 Tax=Streptomyces sp. NPDC051987 TaxID=3155808 RepID=UPI0034413789
MSAQQSDAVTEAAAGTPGIVRTVAPESTGTSLDIALDAAIAIFTGRLTSYTGTRTGRAPAAGAGLRPDLAWRHRALLPE